MNMTPSPSDENWDTSSKAASRLLFLDELDWPFNLDNVITLL